MINQSSSPILLTDRSRKVIWVLLTLLLIVRLLAMAAVPLTNSTEARYG